MLFSLSVFNRFFDFYILFILLLIGFFRVDIVLKK